MDAKLTLKLDKDVIDRAKSYASKKEISLSRLVESYFKSLTSGSKTEKFEISPFVRSLATGIEIPSDLDYKKEYSEYLLEKYK